MLTRLTQLAWRGWSPYAREILLAAMFYSWFKQQFAAQGYGT
ncbi:hypothetical protein ACS15_5626 [Ralstonia insidiosa]|uniref:Uncharacterized protein n=1 Tax=Ralstonia insidiosa TaxID=190721 RepID=A0AAC9BK66_9RALS|nr:hypothetical protein ACS15_5626 [Ralstonia insidiosa]